MLYIVYSRHGSKECINVMYFGNCALTLTPILSDFRRPQVGWNRHVRKWESKKKLHEAQPHAVQKPPRVSVIRTDSSPRDESDRF